jgi:hypothetical protein
MSELPIGQLYSAAEIEQFRQEAARDLDELGVVVVARLDLDGVSVSAAADLLATHVPDDLREPVLWGVSGGTVAALADAVEASGVSWRLTPSLVAAMSQGGSGSAALELLECVEVSASRDEFAELFAAVEASGVPQGVLTELAAGLPAGSRVTADAVRVLAARDWSLPTSDDLAWSAARLVDHGGSPQVVLDVLDVMLSMSPSVLTLTALGDRVVNSGVRLPPGFVVEVLERADRLGVPLVDRAVQVLDMELSADGLGRVVDDLLEAGVPHWYLEAVHEWLWAHPSPAAAQAVASARAAREDAERNLVFPTGAVVQSRLRERLAAADAALAAALAAQRAERTRVMVSSVCEAWSEQRLVLERMHQSGRLDSFWQGSAFEELEWPEVASSPAPTPVLAESVPAVAPVPAAASVMRLGVRPAVSPVSDRSVSIL